MVLKENHPFFYIYNKPIAMEPYFCSKNRVLFICKKRHIYSQQTQTNISSGLYNSAKFVVDMLQNNMIDAKLVDVIDNNCIDKEVAKYRPTHVIIEALWVTPDKFDILQKLHPRVKWIIRLQIGRAHF